MSDANTEALKTLAQTLWSLCADQYNQWDALGADEKEDIISKIGAALSPPSVSVNVQSEREALHTWIADRYGTSFDSFTYSVMEEAFKAGAEWQARAAIPAANDLNMQATEPHDCSGLDRLRERLEACDQDRPMLVHPALVDGLFDKIDMLRQIIDAERAALPAVQTEQLRWQFTGIAGLKRYLTEKQYQAQTSEVKKWYVPICDRCGPAISSPAVQVPEEKTFAFGQTAFERMVMTLELIALRDTDLTPENLACSVLKEIGKWESDAAVAPPAVQVPQWISVEENKPTVNEHSWLKTKHGSILRGWITVDDDYWIPELDSWVGGNGQLVTHHYPIAAPSPTSQGDSK